MSNGILQFHSFPDIKFVNELPIERDILDFQAYSTESPVKTSNSANFVATFHSQTKEIKIAKYQSRTNELKYVTKFVLERIPRSFAVAPNDSFLIQYSRESVEYVRIDNKGGIEQVVRMPIIIDGGLVAQADLEDQKPNLP